MSNAFLGMRLKVAVVAVALFSISWSLVSYFEDIVISKAMYSYSSEKAETAFSFAMGSLSSDATESGHKAIKSGSFTGFLEASPDLGGAYFGKTFSSTDISDGLSKKNISPDVGRLSTLDYLSINSNSVKFRELPGNKFRFSYPISPSSGQNCQSCHSVPRSEVLGVFGVTVSSGKEHQAVSGAIRTLNYGFFAFAAIMLAWVMSMTSSQIKLLSWASGSIDEISKHGSSGRYKKMATSHLRDERDEFIENIDSYSRHVESDARKSANLARDYAQFNSGLLKNIRAISKKVGGWNEDVVSRSSSAEEIRLSINDSLSRLDKLKSSSEKIKDKLRTSRVLWTSIGSRPSEDKKLFGVLTDKLSFLRGYMDAISAKSAIAGDVAEKINLMAITAAIEAAKHSEDSGFEGLSSELQSLAVQAQENHIALNIAIMEAKEVSSKAPEIVDFLVKNFGTLSADMEGSIKDLDSLSELIISLFAQIQHLQKPPHEQKKALESILSIIELLASSSQEVAINLEELSRDLQEKRD